MQNRYIQLFICHVLLVIKLGAGVTVTGDKTVFGGDGLRKVPRYFNETNTISITVALGGDEVNDGSNDLSDYRAVVHYGVNSTSDVTITTNMTVGLDNEGWIGKKPGNDNTVTITFTYLQLNECGINEDEYFDFNVRFTDDFTDTPNEWIDTGNDPVVAADADGISVSASVANNAALVITGAFASGGSCDFGADGATGIKNGRIVTILSASFFSHK